MPDASLVALETTTLLLESNVNLAPCTYFSVEDFTLSLFASTNTEPLTDEHDRPYAELHSRRQMRAGMAGDTIAMNNRDSKEDSVSCWERPWLQQCQRTA